MSTVKTNSLQLGQSVTATNNGTWYQPATPDGTIRYGIGNAGATTADVVTLSSSGLSASALIPSGSTAPTNGLYLPTTNTLAWSTASAEKMRLDSSGNLGLGVTPSGWGSGTSAFDLASGGSAGALSASGTLSIARNGYFNGTNWIYKNSLSAQMIQLTASGTMAFNIAGSGTAGNAISFTQAMTLDASGTLFVGQTTNPATSSVVIKVPTGTGNGVNAQITSNTGTSYPWSNYNASGTYIGGISCTSSATSFPTSSDQRLKTNITPAGSAIQSILDFPVDQFDWIESGEHQDFGAVAQKAISVIPEMVSVPADPEEMWGIDWSKAVPRLIKTIQEMHEEIQILKQKVNA